MRLSRNELIAKLSLGEDSLLECKEVRFSGASVRGPSQNDLADELALGGGDVDAGGAGKAACVGACAGVDLPAHKPPAVDALAAVEDLADEGSLRGGHGWGGGGEGSPELAKLVRSTMRVFARLAQ